MNLAELITTAPLRDQKTGPKATDQATKSVKIELYQRTNRNHKMLLPAQMQQPVLP